MESPNSDYWLPPGWTVELKMRKNGKRDKSASAAKKPKLSVSRARQQVIMGQSSNLDGIVIDQQIPESACAGNQYGIAPEKQLPEGAQTRCETGKAQNRQGKHKNKKEMNLPHRASKRLAGIKADPVPDLKLRAPRVATKQSGEIEDIRNGDKLNGGLLDGAEKQLTLPEDGSETKCDFDNSTKIVESDQVKHPYGNLSTPERLPERTLQERKCDKNQARFSLLPLENQDNLKEQMRDPEIGNKLDLKLDDSLGLPLGELLTDPCIAFAVQTLTGITFETSTSSQISTESNNISASGVGYLKKIDGEKQGCNLSLPPENLAISEEQAGDAETLRKASEKLGFSSDMPLEVSWMDPCIEFAVKTLTDNIPLDYGLNMQQDSPQQQSGSSNTKGHCEMAFSGVSINKLCQSDFYGNQYFGMQNMGFKQPPFVEPTLENGRSFGVDNSAGSGLPQCGVDRKNGCQR